MEGGVRCDVTEGAGIQENGMRTFVKFAAIFIALTATPFAVGQITSPGFFRRSAPDCHIEEQLINRLRATCDDQRAYIKHVVDLTKREVEPVPRCRRAVRRSAEFQISVCFSNG